MYVHYNLSKQNMCFDDEKMDSRKMNISAS